jgi:hypothetical protein
MDNYDISICLFYIFMFLFMCMKLKINVIDVERRIKNDPKYRL